MGGIHPHQEKILFVVGNGPIVVGYDAEGNLEQLWAERLHMFVDVCLDDSNTPDIVTFTVPGATLSLPN